MSSWINKLERRLEPLAISNITLYLVIAQVFVLLSAVLGQIDLMQLHLWPALVMEGEVWRLFTFVAIPPPFDGSFGPVFVAFALYLFYLYGGALEQYLGVVRYNLFLLVGYLLTVGIAFLSPMALATNLFLGGTVFLAFAFINPNFTLQLFFILPVKIKWLALLTWVYYGYIFLTGGATARLGILAATGNFFIFFGSDIIQRLKTGRHRVKAQAKREKLRQELSGPMHKCSVCERDSDGNHELDFRYRTEGDAEVCYCEDHLPPKTGE
ncbi:MAG: hypothetical protein HOH58_02785 [Opitutaceae bacterium]|mgnify:CR=1 FL=1|jgi:hypothetical protein|nr:hypothetical protein [Opitutaceae bacterium]